MTETTLGTYITRLREEKGWSLRELDRRSGVNYETIRKIEMGENKNPGTKTIADIARALNVNPVKMMLAFDGKDPDTNDNEATTEWVRELKERVPDIRKLLELIDKSEPGGRE